MQWENLTSPDFAKAVQDTGVCILPMGVVERHGDHLPLGTDFLNCHKIACMAAEKEPAVVFPPFYFGQIYEARCFPGTVTLKPSILLDVVGGVLDEIGRNGFKKIIIYNGHGGNNHLIPFLAQSALWEERPYCIYVSPFGVPVDDDAFKAIFDTEIHAHACECETSLTLFNFPSLVKMDAIPEKPVLPLNRLEELSQGYTGIWWYADFPDHYSGDARAATAQKGEKFALMNVDILARFIALVKSDKIVPRLNKEFFERAGNISK